MNIFFSFLHLQSQKRRATIGIIDLKLSITRIATRRESTIYIDQMVCWVAGCAQHQESNVLEVLWEHQHVGVSMSKHKGPHRIWMQSLRTDDVSSTKDVPADINEMNNSKWAHSRGKFVAFYSVKDSKKLMFENRRIYIYRYIDIW